LFIVCRAGANIDSRIAVDVGPTSCAGKFSG
jgi:hypothetical protein